MHEHPGALGDRVHVHLQRVEAVLQRVLGADREVGELARLAGGGESAAEPVGERGAEDESAGLGADDQVDLARLCPSARSSTAWCSAWASARSGMMSLNTMPGRGNQGRRGCGSGGRWCQRAILWPGCGRWLLTDPAASGSITDVTMYDMLRASYRFHCPARPGGELVRVPLSAFRRLERLPGAAHPAVYRVEYDCGCGESAPGAGVARATSITGRWSRSRWSSRTCSPGAASRWATSWPNWPRRRYSVATGRGGSTAAASRG